MSENKRKKQAILLRRFRTIHRFVGLALMVFILLVAVTGILLGWKKHSGQLIQDKNYEGTSKDFATWMPLDSLHTKAIQVFKDSISVDIAPSIDRIDVRKDKGMIKFIFENGYWGIQLDGATGNVLHIEKRTSDFIENLHDASFFDKYFGTSNEQIKLVFTTLTGFSLLLFCITGFWLWYGPKRMKRSKK